MSRTERLAVLDPELVLTTDLGSTSGTSDNHLSLLDTGICSFALPDTHFS